MQNDLYRQVIHELSNKSEKDFGFTRVEDEKTRIVQYISTGISLLFQLSIITVVSGLFAIRYDEISSLSINLYIVIVSFAIFGTLNYPSLWRKFTRKRIIIIILLISVWVALIIFVPSKIFSQIDHQLPLFTWWGAMVIAISIIIYLISYTLVTLAELLLDSASVFLPVLPTTFGEALPDLAAETYKILGRETIGKNDLKYLISASQADIDSAGIRSLPWVVLLGFGATSFSDLFKGTISINIFLGFPLLFIGLMAIFNMARMVYFQTLIIQVANSLLIELSAKDSTSSEKPNIFMGPTENNKMGCLLRILFPWA